MKSFQQLGLSGKLLEVLDQMGFETPTPIQKQAIPILLGEDPTDFIGLAQTGTGKTAAFGLPLLDLIDADSQTTQVLVLAPTRELGQQTAQQMLRFSENQPGIKVEVVYGGASIVPQLKAMKKRPQVLVATPGRLLDLIQRKAVSLNAVEYVVLDEADEMLNMGFKEDIDSILSHTPENRVTWLFSATMPPEIRKIIHKYMDSPREVSVNRVEKTNTDITHQYVVTKTTNKVPAIRRFLDKSPEMRGILFCRTKRETQKIADDLGNLGYSVEALHGDLSQSQRDAVMRRFKTRDMQLLCATDVAARGIDVNNLSHVLHHTLPDQVEYYTHRSGRTGRAGQKGISLAFINSRENGRLYELEKKTGIKFQKTEVPSMEELLETRLKNWATKLLDQEIDPKAEAHLMELEPLFEGKEKSDLLLRLLSRELEGISGPGETGDLNYRNQDKGYEGGNSGYHRFFINVGTMDGFNRAELSRMLVELSGIKKKHLGKVDVKKNCAFFEIADSQSAGFGDRFEGITLEDRPIRVNRDHQGPSTKPRGNRPKPKFKGGHGKPKGNFSKGKNNRKSFRGRR